MLRFNVLRIIILILCLISPSIISNVYIIRYGTCNINMHIDTHMKFKDMSFEHFLYELAQRESGGNCKIYNKYGYMGKYQMSELTLKDIGIDWITFEEFKSNYDIFPEVLQEYAIRRYIIKNKMYTKKIIKDYVGDTINGILITESGIIAAAHLVGCGNVIKWFESLGSIDITDGNGVSITSYLESFKGYIIL